MYCKRYVPGGSMAAKLLLISKRRRDPGRGHTSPGTSREE